MAQHAQQGVKPATTTERMPQKPEQVQQTHASGPGPVLQPHSARVQHRLSGPADILSLHQTIGNQAVMRLLDKQRAAVQAKATDDSEKEGIQLRSEGQGEPSNAEIHSAAARGISTPATPLPFLDRIQASFGRHSIGHIKAHVGPEAARASRDMNALAFASGDHVVFSGSPDLHTTAHEAAHVVQQQTGVQLSGGVGQVGDRYEQHAEAVAKTVMEGGSAEGLLSPFSAPFPTSQTQIINGYGLIEKLKLPVAPMPGGTVAQLGIPTDEILPDLDQHLPGKPNASNLVQRLAVTDAQHDLPQPKEIDPKKYENAVKYLDTLAAMESEGQPVVDLGKDHQRKLDHRRAKNYYIRHGLQGGSLYAVDRVATDMAARSESDGNYDVMMIICSAFAYPKEGEKSTFIDKLEGALSKKGLKNVEYKVTGSAYYMEWGEEIGAYTHGHGNDADQDIAKDWAKRIVDKFFESLKDFSALFDKLYAAVELNGLAKGQEELTKRINEQFEKMRNSIEAVVLREKELAAALGQDRSASTGKELDLLTKALGTERKKIEKAKENIEKLEEELKEAKLSFSKASRLQLVVNWKIEENRASEALRLLRPYKWKEDLKGEVTYGKLLDFAANVLEQAENEAKENGNGTVLREVRIVKVKLLQLLFDDIDAGKQNELHGVDLAREAVDSTNRLEALRREMEKSFRAAWKRKKIEILRVRENNGRWINRQLQSRVIRIGTSE